MTFAMDDVKCAWETERMRAPTGHLVTADELIRMRDDGFRYELVEGRLIAMTPAGSLHGRLIVRLSTALDSFVEEHDLGAVFAADPGFRLARAPDTVRAPDVSFVRKDRLPETGLPAGYWPGPPDLAVEVVSPGDSTAEVESKVQEYLRKGVRLVWVVFPLKRVVAVHRPGAPLEILGENDVLDGDEVVPGFRYPLARLCAVKSRG
jgi:Uma2 family endonuclease